MTKHFLLILLSYISLTATSNAAGWTAELTIDSVWIQDNLIVAETSGGAGVYYSGCVSSKYVMNVTTSDAKNQAVSMLMTAATTG